MDKDTRLRARAIRNLKDSFDPYDEDDILAEMDRLMEAEEEKERREDKTSLSYAVRHREEIQANRRLEQRAKLLRLRALRKLKSYGVPYDDTDLELELDNQSRLCDKAEDNLHTSTLSDDWSENKIRAEMERLEAEEEEEDDEEEDDDAEDAEEEDAEDAEEEERSRASASSAATEPSKLRIQALRNLKALGDPFDEYDIEIEIANILESRSSTPSKSSNGRRK